MKKLIYTISLATLLIFCGCSDFFISEVDPDTLPEQHSRLVVYGFIENGKINQIAVSYSIPYYIEDTSQSRSISDARVTLTYKNIEYLFQFNTSTGFYEYSGGNALIFNPKDTVFLQVEADGFETVSAESIIPEKNPKLLDIIKIDTTTQTQWFDNARYLNFYCYFVDIKDETNIYQPSLNAYYKTDTGMGDLAYLEPSEPVVTDVNRDGDTIFIKFSQYLGNINYENLKDSVDFSLKSFDREAGMFIKSRSRQNQTDNGNPFAEPVIIYTNIRNGLGVFGSANNYGIRLRIK